MDFDVDKLLLCIAEYQRMYRIALFEIVKDHTPFNKYGFYDYNVGLANMNDKGICTLSGEELKGRVESFETILGLINKIAIDEKNQQK